MEYFGYAFLIVLGLGIISIIWNFLKNISEVLVNILFIIAGVALWLWGAPQAAIILGMNSVLAYIIFGILDFFLCIGIYATIKGEV